MATTGTPPQHLADRVLELVDGRAQALVRAVRTRHGLTRFANSHVHQHVGEDTTGVELRLLDDGRALAVATSRIGDEALGSFVEGALSMLSAAPVDPSAPGPAPDAPAPDLPQVAPDDDATPDGRVEVVARFVAAGDDLNAAGYCETLDEQVALHTSAGRRRSGRATRATIDGIHRTDSSAGTGHGTARTLAELDGAAAGARAAGLARRGTAPGELEPGDYEVVLAPEPVATMAAFLSVYAFNARAVAEQRSAVVVGAEQFDPAVSLYSDATDARSITLPFDHEGTDRTRTPLVEAGRVAGLAHDRRSAAAAGTTSTGAHMAYSDQMGPVAEALVVTPGAIPGDELVAQVERGILVTAFNYCRVLDPKTLVVTGLTRNGTFLVEDGRITRALGNLRFTQSFTEALAPGNVLAVGDDDRHADSEFGAGLAIAPSLRLARFRITGNQQG